MQLERVFNAIQNERMAGIPLLNLELQVEAVGFSEFKGRVVGVLITPWLMNLVLFPAADEDWSRLEVGSKQSHEFPSGPRDFVVNAFDGLGICQTQALYSPMFGFRAQDSARLKARRIMDELMVFKAPEERLDEKRLERFINGEEGPQIRQEEVEAGARSDKAAPVQSGAPVQIARSDFIRGKFSR